MSNQLATIEKEIRALGPKFGRYSVNKEEIAFGRESIFAMAAIRKSEALQKCDLDSIRDAVMNIAFVGLTLNPALGYAYLVPHYNKQSKRQEAVLWMGYKGMEKLATSGGAVSAIEAHVVYAADEFFIEQGTSPRVIHRIKNPSKRGEPIGAYCIATVAASGQKLVEFMNREDILKARAVAKTGEVWDGPFGLEQWRKTVIRRASKHWPRDAALEHLDEALGRLEAAEFEPHVAPPDVEPIVCITDEQALELHALLTDHSLAPEKWLTKLAASEGIPKIGALPRSEFIRVRDKLKSGVDAFLKQQAAK